MRFRFDPTISAGSILSLIALLLALLGMSNKIEHRLTALETKVTALEASSTNGR